MGDDVFGVTVAFSAGTRFVAECARFEKEYYVESSERLSSNSYTSKVCGSSAP